MAARVLKQTCYQRNSAGCGCTVGPMNCRFVMKRLSIFIVEPYRNAISDPGMGRRQAMRRVHPFWILAISDVRITREAFSSRKNCCCPAPNSAWVHR